MDKLAPGAARLAYIGQDVARAAPGEQLSVFVERANTAGKLLRKGFFTPEVIEQELWGVAEAHNLSGQPGSEAEEYIADVINKAIAIDDDDEPRATNGRDDWQGPTEIPESADADRAPIKNTTTPPSDQPPLTLITPCQWKGVDLEEMRWLATHRIPADDVTILSSDGAGGKRNLLVAGLVGAAMCSACWCGSLDRWP